MTATGSWQPLPKVRVIFHADDFGETEEITRGIVEALEGGVLKSTSILANMPGSEFALIQARNLMESTSFGVHVNLCEGKPLTSVPSLVDDAGRFLSKGELTRRALAGKLDLRDLEREIEGQVDSVVSQGISISHIDGHKHMHLLPGVRKAVIRVAGRFGIERVRVTAERTMRVAASLRRMLRELIARQAAREFATAGCRYPDRVRDLTQYLTLSPPELAGRLGALAGTTEVFCHPGTEVADREKPGSCERSRELAYLIRPGLREALEEREIEVISFWEV